MDDIRPIAVVTSRSAQKHMEDIKMQHTDILKGMQEQEMRVQQNTQQTQQKAEQKQSGDRDYELKRLTAMV